MPFAESGDCRIWYDVHGSGPAVVLYHGFGGSSEDWLDFGGVAPLAEDYQLILLDARGHGRSDKPHDTAHYRLEHKVGDVVAVLDDLGIERSHYYGYSYGGLMGWALGIHAPERFASMVIGGAQPFAPEGLEMYARYNAMLTYLERGTQAYVAWREEHGVVWPDPFRSRMLANDAAALRAYFEMTLHHYPLGDLSRMSMPVLVVSGDDDELMAGENARRATAMLPHGRFAQIANADHPALYLDGARVLPLLSGFLAAVTQPVFTQT